MFGIVWVLKRKRTSEMRAAGEVEVLWMGQHVPPPPLAQRQRSLNSIVPHSYETFTLYLLALMADHVFHMVWISPSARLVF